ncbi:keratin, type II cytoskeletal 80-like [Gastrophryne carolinensis]
MATSSKSSGYGVLPWRSASTNGDSHLSPSPDLSESYATKSYITTTKVNGSCSVQTVEEVFKTKLTVSSDTQTTMSHQDDGEEKLSADLMSFQDKIKYLEKQREVLEDRWAMLQVENTSGADLEPIYLSHISQLLAQVNDVTKKNNEKQRSLLDLVDSVNDIKDKFEGELCLRTDTEYSFVQLKKDVDNCSLEKTELEVKQQELKSLIELMTSVYEMELKEVMEESGDISVQLNMSSQCPLNLEKIVKEIQERYESIAMRNREEAQALSKNKLQQGILQAGRCETELENSRIQITQLNSKIQRLRSEVLSLQTQNLLLEQNVSASKSKTEATLKDAETKLTEVQEALQKAKHNAALQLKQHQDLMNIKLALDMEIVTYRKLLETEENWLNCPPVVNVHHETEKRRSSRPRTSSNSLNV